MGIKNYLVYLQRGATVAVTIIQSTDRLKKLKEKLEETNERVTLIQKVGKEVKELAVNLKITVVKVGKTVGKALKAIIMKAVRFVKRQLIKRKIKQIRMMEEATLRLIDKLGEIDTLYTQLDGYRKSRLILEPLVSRS